MHVENIAQESSFRDKDVKESILVKESNYGLATIVVPVYKVEKYLHRCVDSILAQTYKNIEVILVDDGSPDKCGEICDEYCRKDNRVKVIHKKMVDCLKREILG